MSERQPPQPCTQVDIVTLKKLNGLKHRVQQVTRLLDGTGTRVFPRHTIEATQLMHAVSILLSELDFHGLLPADVMLETQLPAERKIGEAR